MAKQEQNIEDIVERELAKALASSAAEKEVEKEQEHRSSKNLKKIGRYIVDRRQLEDKVPKSIDRTTKKAYDDAVSYIDANEKDMSDSTDDQRRIYSQVKDTLIKVRTSNSYEELESRRKNLEFLKKLNSDETIDENDVGAKKAKNYIEKLIIKIHEESKPSKIKEIGRIAKSDLFSQEGTMLGSLINEFKFVGKMLSVAGDKKAKTANLDAFDDEIFRLSRIEKSPSAKYKAPVTKSADPGITTKQSPAVTSVPTQEPIKIGNQKIYPDDPMYNKIMGKQSIAAPSGQETVVDTKHKEQKTSTLTVDKLVAKTILVDKPIETKQKPHIKLKSKSSVENKPFKTELFGEEPSTTSPVKEEKGILDTVKDMIMGSFIGKQITKAGGIGNAVRAAGAASVPLAIGAAPLAAMGLVTQQAGSADMNDTEQTNIFSSVARFGKGIADKWNAFTGGPNKEAQIKRIKENIEERGAKYSPEEAREIKEKYGYDVPESALTVATKPTMIEQSAQTIPKTTERLEQQAKETAATPVIIQQPSAPAEPQQATVIPIKGSIRTSESSFRRFQDRNFKG